MLHAGLQWREVALLRAYAHYAAQLGGPFGRQYVADILLAHPAAARALVELFRARFDPAPTAEQRAGRSAAALATATALIDEVTGLDADRILRGHLALVDATLRTNWFRGRPHFSFKIDPARGAGHAAAAAAVRDLRVLAADGGGAPAVRAGGPGWAALVGPSAGLPDRDPRPGQGAGGEERGDRAGGRQGRVRGACRAPRPRRGARPATASSSPGLLDVTDNLSIGADGAETVPPPDVVRHDGDDAYLVVAADKGTARFSDVANDVARRYGFWLGDAFASGGSVGYDHKAMGITARGAWESVRRHFRELGVDTQTEDITVVGVGDMSGDVFGNGMLLSRHIRLVAAFDHRHVFVDPDPDPAVGLRRATAAVRAAALLVGRLRPGGDQPRWRGVAAHREGGPRRPGDPGRARAGRRASAR